MAEKYILEEVAVWAFGRENRGTTTRFQTIISVSAPAAPATQQWPSEGHAPGPNRLSTAPHAPKNPSGKWRLSARTQKLKSPCNIFP